MISLRSELWSRDWKGQITNHLPLRELDKKKGEEEEKKGKGKGNPTTLVPRDDETCFSPRILPSIRRGDSSFVRDSRSPTYT